MSVSTTISSISYSGNASTTAAYPTTFPFFDASDLTVVVNTAGVPTVLVQGTGYTVSGGAGLTGSITTTSAVPATSTVVITRNTAKTQLTSYTTGDRFPASTQEKALDKLTMLVQEATSNTLPSTSTASGTAPYVLQAGSIGAAPAWVPQSSSAIADGSITNAKLAGGITPAKLSTGGPTWDTSGNLTATSFVGPVTGAVTGNASTATKLANARTVSIAGDVAASAVSFDGSSNITLTSAISAGSVTASKLGTNEQKQIAKSWGVFTTSSGAISGNIYQYNIQSITRVGTTGAYTVLFSNALPDGNYAVVTGCADASYNNGLFVSARSATGFTLTAANVSSNSVLNSNTGTWSFSVFSN